MSVERAEEGGVEIAIATLVEEREDETRWETTLRSWSDEGPERWLWTDIEAVGSGSLERVAVAAPRLAVELIATGVSPSFSGVGLTTSARSVEGVEAGEELAALITGFDRELPVVVFTRDPVAWPESSAPPLKVVADRAAAYNAGLACVVVADSAVVEVLNDALGLGYSVWGGAFRIYRPDVDPAVDNDQWRHRYFRPDRFSRYRDTAGKAISRAIAPESATRRPPISYATAKALLTVKRAHARGDREMLLMAFDEIEASKRQVISLTEQAAAHEEDLFATVIDWEGALEEVAFHTALNDELHTRIRILEEQLGDSDLHAGDLEPTYLSAVPDDASSPTEAAHLARTLLADRLVIPIAALHDLEILDSTVSAAAWGQTSWRAFRALHAYATELADRRYNGDFWTWCANSKHPRVWPANDKKLSMRESKTVETSPRLRQHRVLPVDLSVDPSGSIYMPAHIKVATGGGNLAPRIYFHVDGANGAVHVGFFGPHKYMPNTKT